MTKHIFYICYKRVVFVAIIFLLVQNTAPASSSISPTLVSNHFVSEASIFGFSDTWFTRNIVFRQSPYNATTVKYNNVVLNSVIDGSFRGDFSVFQIFDIDIYNAESNSYASSVAINNRIMQKSADRSGITTIFEGGNIFGSTLIDLKGKSGFVNWNTGINYITSGGFDVSSAKPDTINLSRKNTAFEKITANARLNVSDFNSTLDAEFIFSTSKQNMPFNLYPENSIYLQEPDFTMNLLNIMFRSYIDNGFEIYGNLFYLRSKSILEKYDSAQLITRDLESSFVKSFEESRFGWNSTLKFDTENIPPGEITFNYSREGLKYQPNSGLPINKYEIEKLSLGIHFSEVFNRWHYSIGGNYDLLNPLTAYQNEFFESIGDFSYFFKTEIVDIVKDLNVSASLSRKIMLPQLYTIYSELNHTEIYEDLPITSVNNSLELVFAYHNIGLKLFYSQYDKIQLPFSLIGSNFSLFDNNFSSSGIEIKARYRLIFGMLLLSSQYLIESNNILDSYGREIIIPEFKANISFSDVYDFGLSWLISSDVIIGRKSNYFEPKNLKDFALINLSISQLVYQQNEIYLKINNLTNEYYEYFYGMPMPGIYFVAGIKLIL